MENTESKRLIKVVITGPESTGKTVLTEELAAHYHTVFIPEYAREYILHLNRSYTYAD
ncbi:MAG: ATP-binding protein, partial [Bacteroidales bacterium]|nr:ATP-binding protein [Bacteroidales bacterium]